SYLCYVVLYIKVIRLKREHRIESKFKGIICPIMAMLGSGIILVGGIISNPFYVPCFIIFCAFVCLLGYLYRNRN
ncbi:MAG TPA: hypothetical protein VHP81_11000, partial [Lachnospiraceae bacterium]|nr:hypothetical protein [Lachnospiraceae bacterium]